MPETSNQPLLTFAIGAFNQERFVREAVEAAFAQTYSPLEIILSDDCSGDRTFEIMTEMAAAYRGPHKLVLNRNPVRRSIGGHVNRLLEVSKGELIIGAAGDDVSLPERTQVTFEAWERSGRRATSIHSSILQIDEQGHAIKQIFESEAARSGPDAVEQRVDALSYVRTLEPLVYGCAHAYSRRLFTVFGNLPDEIIHEDSILALRSALAGSLCHISQPLVKYRVHGNNVYVRNRARGADMGSFERQEDRLVRDFKNRETMYAAFVSDLEKARAQRLLGEAACEQAIAAATALHRRYVLQRRFLESPFFAKCGILFRLWRLGSNPKEFKILLRRLMPRPWLVRLRLARSYLSLERARTL